jgi:hypothetical protein
VVRRPLGRRGHAAADVAIGRANESALVLEARKGSGALVTSGAVGTLGLFSGLAIPH